MPLTISLRAECDTCHTEIHLFTHQPVTHTQQWIESQGWDYVRLGDSYVVMCHVDRKAAGVEI